MHRDHDEHGRPSLIADTDAELTVILYAVAEARLSLRWFSRRQKREQRLAIGSKIQHALTTQRMHEGLPLCSFTESEAAVVLRDTEAYAQTPPSAALHYPEYRYLIPMAQHLIETFAQQDWQSEA